MSYTESYSETIHYSGSKTVSYPASEHGGTQTVHYSGDVPVHIHIHVDTDDFDRSVAGTNAALGVVTGALTAMEAAQVAEVMRAGEEISQSATHGFFRVLASEMSTSVSEFSSSMRSSAGLLAHEAQQVEQVHRQMASDYAAIRARYLRIFGRLDDELERRVCELDRSAHNIALHAMRDVVTGPYVREAARTLTEGEETSTAQLKLQCAQAKRRAAESLESLAEVCGYLGDYAEAVDGIMVDDPSEGIVFVPVIVARERDLAGGEPHTRVYEVSDGQGGVLTEGVAARVAHIPDAQWQRSAQTDKAEVDQGFQRRLVDYAAGGGDERVAALIGQLYAAG